MKPSEEIEEIAKKIHMAGNPGFTGYIPTIGDYVMAIVEYLDKKYNEKGEKP
jgi:hypothetical protein